MRLSFASMASIIVFGCGSPSPPIFNGDPQTPPNTGFATIEPWLNAGFFKSWHCRDWAFIAVPPHGEHVNCSNNLLSAAGPGEFPVGSAAILAYVDPTDPGPNPRFDGYLVSLHTQAGTTGDTWYWYERRTGVVAPTTDGQGSAGPPLKCVGCHMNAGSSGNAGHDFVYSQIR